MSTDQVTSTASGTTGSTGLGAITGTLQGGVNSLINLGTKWLDKIFPPKTREDVKQKLLKFATEKPYLASFLLSQIAISGFPLFLFVVMTITVVIFALVVGLLVGLVGAVLFILGAVGFALVILLPTLFVTTFAAVGIWLWGMGIYHLAKWFNKEQVPGVHKPMGESKKKSTGLGDTTSGTDGQHDEKKPQANGTASGVSEKQHSYKARPEKKKQASPEQSNPGANGVTESVPGVPALG